MAFGHKKILIVNYSQRRIFINNQIAQNLSSFQLSIDSIVMITINFQHKLFDLVVLLNFYEVVYIEVVKFHLPLIFNLQYTKERFDSDLQRRTLSLLKIILFFVKSRVKHQTYIVQQVIFLTFAYAFVVFVIDKFIYFIKDLKSFGSFWVKFADKSQTFTIYQFTTQKYNKFLALDALNSFQLNPSFDLFFENLKNFRLSKVTQCIGSLVLIPF